jgi:hypothetical protein
MARATAGRTTGLISIDGQIFTDVTILLNKIVSRKRVDLSDVDLIKDLYNLFRVHTHSMFDQESSGYGTWPVPTLSATDNSYGAGDYITNEAAGNIPGTPTPADEFLFAYNGVVEDTIRVFVDGSEISTSYWSFIAEGGPGDRDAVYLDSISGGFSAAEPVVLEYFADAPNLAYTINMDVNDHGATATNIFDLIAQFNQFVHEHSHTWDDTVSYT